MKKWMTLLSITAAVLVSQAAEVPFQGPKITGGAVYRGNVQRNGVFNKTGVVKLKGAKWKANIGGKLTSSPVVFENTLYIGGADGFYALNTDSGSVRWKYPSDKQVESSACVANGTVCFTTIDGELIALNAADGAVKWKYQGRASATSRGSPVVAYGTVLVPLGKEIVMVSLNDGKKIWSTDQHVPDEYSSIACTADAFYGTGHLTWGNLYSYEYETGKINWRISGNFDAGVYLYKTPAVGEDGFIYINETRGARKFSPVAQGTTLKGQNQILWYTFLLDKQVEDNAMIPQACPTVWNGMVFAGRFDGKLCALDTKDGKIIWKKMYPGSLISDPSIAAKSGLMYFGCYDGNLYAVDAATGEERWQFKTGGKIFASPWIADGLVYIASQDGCVYALE
jgi:outer membrane protein assembly factor BamB